MNRWDKHALNRVTKNRQVRKTTQPLAKFVDQFVRREVVPRQKKLSRLGQAWCELLPEMLRKHTCLENIYRGTLKILVDDGPSLYELSQLKEELLVQLRQLCPSVAPAEIRFVRGFWYHTNEEGTPIPDYKSIKPKENKKKING
jgi:Dna[CI] antecedent, DciA